ncbi:hypothetical protein ACGFSD_05345 [Streptomyces caniferus]|uniref:hypothetical protein n=1 Tax=Streptomyces caniferus TaxID=285557 RepID=UPI0033EF0094
MHWWIKARRAHINIPVGLVTFAVLVWLFRDRLAAMPSLAGGNEVQLMLLAPLSVCAAIIATLSARVHDVEDAGVRPFARMDAVLVICVVLAAVGIGYGFSWVLGSGAAGAVGRNTALLTGLMLICRPLLGERSLVIPLAWILFVVVEGYDGLGHPHAWALLPEPGTNIPVLAITTAVFVSGVLLSSRRRV